MSEFCIECGQLVRLRQQGLQCELCGGWIHRICGTGIFQQTYREAVRNELTLNWRCASCRTDDLDPESEKTALATADDSSSITTFMPVVNRTPSHSNFSIPQSYLSMRLFTQPPNSP